jgi:hypothetical protein
MPRLRAWQGVASSADNQTGIGAPPCGSTEVGAGGAVEVERSSATEEVAFAPRPVTVSAIPIGSACRERCCLLATLLHLGWFICILFPLPIPTCQFLVLLDDSQARLIQIEFSGAEFLPDIGRVRQRRTGLGTVYLDRHVHQ